jgi:hypothetical protein
MIEWRPGVKQSDQAKALGTGTARLSIERQEISPNETFLIADYSLGTCEFYDSAHLRLG